MSTRPLVLAALPFASVSPGGVLRERLHLNDLTMWTGRLCRGGSQSPTLRSAIWCSSWAGTANPRTTSGCSTSPARPPGAATGSAKPLPPRGLRIAPRPGAGDEALRRGARHARAQGRFESLLPFSVRTPERTLVATGEAPVHAEPDYRGNRADAVVYEEGRGTRFAVLARILETDGHVTGTGATLQLEDAHSATLLVSIGTSFAGFDREPGLDGRDERALARESLEAAAARSFSEPAARHVEDFARFYDRVVLELGDDPAPGLTTDERLKRPPARPTPTLRSSTSSSGATC